MTAVTSDPAVDEVPEQDPAVEKPADPEVLAQVNELAISPTQKTFTPEQLALLDAQGIDVANIKPAMMQGFLLLCLARGVNPFIGEATIMPTSDGWAAILKIDGYRTIAERTGEYEGRTKPEWCDEEGNWYDAWPKALGRPFGARVGIWRRGHREADVAVVYTHEVEVYKRVPRPGQKGYYDEVLTERWTDGGQVIFLLSKCAEAAAFRIAFPRELDGFYTPEEMERANRLRQENEARRAADEARALRRAAFEAAQAPPERETREEGVQEGVVVNRPGPQTVGERMGAVRDLIGKAHAGSPPPEPEAAAPVEEVPAARPALAPEVPADLPLSEEERVECLRAELAEQAAIYGIPVDLMVKPYAAIYEGDPLSTWGSDVLLSIVAFWRPRVTTKLESLGRYGEAAAYREAGPEYVDRPDVLFGRSVQPVGDGS